MTERFCRVCGRWHRLDNWPAACVPDRNGALSALAAPRIISDCMDPVQSQLDGKLYDSKSTLRRTYHEAGVVEVGNDSSVTRPRRKQPTLDRRGVKASVAKAFSQAGLGS